MGVSGNEHKWERDHVQSAMNELMDDLVRFKQEAEYYRSKEKRGRQVEASLACAPTVPAVFT